LGRERVARLWPDRLTHLFTVSGIVADRAYHPVRQTLVGHDTLRLSRRRPPREERRRRDRGGTRWPSSRLLGRGHGGPAARPRTSSVPLPPRRWVLHISISVPSPSRDSGRHRRAASLATKRRDVDTSHHRGDRRRHGPQERASLLSLFSCGDTSPGGLCPCMSPTVAWRGAFSRGRAVMAQGKTRQEPPQ